ncbi:hypothetical protein [Terrisporobacter vanillatitrophus]|uniref:hypothetical protein n=1 Tax=Terrisporobacter vanillatitrophus TaxID=3058402 RepID=UPI0033665746
MGKQIIFFMDDEAEKEFFEFIKESAVVLFEDDNGLLKVIDTLPNSNSVRHWRKLYIYNDKFGDYTLNDLDNGRVYLDLYKSPVIEFNRTIIRENTKDMSRGRLWFENSFYDEDELVYKDPNLDKLYQKLCRWIRKKIPKVEVNAKNGIKKEYISKPLINLIESGYEIY